MATDVMPTTTSSAVPTVAVIIPGYTPAPSSVSTSAQSETSSSSA